jgi:hypothetical protein
MTIRFPHINLDAADGRAGRGFHGAEYEQGGTRGVGGYRRPRCERGSVVCVEGPEDGAFG